MTDATPYRATDPIVRLLGPGVTRNGPFGVLGLPVSPADEETIVAAVHARMAAVDAHPESRTPGADEARLAIHAAAANLLNPGVQEELLRRLGPSQASTNSPGVPPARPAARTPTLQAVPSPKRSLHRLEADLLRSIGAEGGWGPAARDRFIKLAHAQGYDTQAAVASMQRLTGAIGRQGTTDAARSGRASAGSPRGAEASPPAAHVPRVPGSRETGSRETVSRETVSRVTQSPAPRPTEPSAQSVAQRFAQPAAQPIEESSPYAFMRVADEPAESPVKAVIIVCAIVVLMVLVGGVSLLLLSGGSPAPTPTAPVARATPPTPPRADRGIEQAPANDAPKRRTLDNAPAILYELETATEGLSVDAEAALAGFDLAIASLAERWGGFAESDRLASQDLIIGFMYRVSGRRESIDRAFASIASGLASADDGRPADADAIWRSAWSMGTLVRLRREQNLPSSLVRQIDAALLESAGRIAPNASTFRAGAVAALNALADPLSGTGLKASGAPAWRAWTQAVRAAAGGDEGLISTMYIAAIDGRLRHGSRQIASDAEVISVLVGAMDWAEGMPARPWLVRAFDDRTLGIDEIHTVTLALANASAAGGVSHAMVLPRGAGDYDRRMLRDRYRELWALTQDADQGASQADFIATARATLLADPTGEGQGTVEIMAEIVRTARLNAVAAMLWRADTTAAADLLKDLDSPINALRSGEGAPDMQGLFATSGGTWAEEYISAGSHIQKRSDLLATALGRRGRLGPMEAEVIVEEAFRGSPLRVRDAAIGIVESEMSEPTIVNAVLEALPMMPKSDRNAALVERIAGVTLPDVRAKEWAFEARRAVVEQLLALIAGHGEYARLDALAAVLDSAYSDRLGGPGSGLTGSGGANASAPAAPTAGIGPVMAGPSMTGSSMTAQQAARELASQWIASAERRPPAAVPGISVEEILGRRAARLSAADGFVQDFHAEQLALMEAMMQVVAGEATGRETRVAALLQALRQSRGRARSVLTQIELTERAMLELWLIRFGEEAS